jgi:hypothetical protein
MAGIGGWYAVELVEAVLRLAMGLGAEMPLAKHGGGIAEVAL